MKPIRLAKTAIAVNAALFLSASMAMPTFADETAAVEKAAPTKTVKKDTKKKAKKDVEVIEVTGIRGSLRDNLNNKRYSDNIVDSINTEDINKNPDKNVAEALQRIAGVQITREFGEGSKISIRGTSPDLTNTLINGQSAKSAEYLPGKSESNAFDFSNVPAEQVAKIEVFKSAQADLDAGGIGGTVILTTKKPLDQENGYGYFNVEGEYNDSSKKTSPQISTAYNFKTDDETFGASISVSYQGRNAFRTGFETNGVALGSGWGTGFAPTDAIQCVTESCDNSDFNLSNINNHAMIVTRHMALNDYTYGDLANIASRPYWNNNANDWGAGNTNIDPTYLDPDWGLFWGSRRRAGLGQTPGRVLGEYVYSPAFKKEEKRLDTTVNFQWAPTDELSFNLELNKNHSNRGNKSDNLYAQPYRMVQYLYSNEVDGIDPRLVMDAERDITLSATAPIDGVWLVRGAGMVWDGNNYYDSSAKWGEMVRRDSNDRSGTATDQSRVHFTMDYNTDNIALTVQAGRVTGDSNVMDRGTTLATRYGDYDTPYSGDRRDLQIPSYEGVNLGYAYNPDTGKTSWGIEADPSLTGEALAAAQQRAKNFLLAPTNEFYLLQGGLRNSEQTRKNVEDFAQADIEWELDNDFYIKSVKFGAKYRNIDRTNRSLTENFRYHGYANESSDFPLILAQNLVGGIVSGLDTAGNDTPDEYFDIDQSKRQAMIDGSFLTLNSEGTPNKAACAAAISDAAAAGDTTNYYGCRSGLTESAGSAYDVNEQILAYYAMANFGGEKFRGNIGLRVVDTKRKSITNEVAKDENGQPQSFTSDETDPNYIAELAGFNMYQPFSQKSSTTDYLPSFNLAIDLTTDVVLRAAASKNISHPTLNQMKSIFRLNTERFRLYTDGRDQDLTPNGEAERLSMDSQRRGSVGNPDLGSNTSINTELGFEWYFTESSMFAVTAFQKDITNMVRKTTKLADLTALGEAGKTDDGGYNIFGNYVISSYFNTGAQKVRGLEVQLQHDFDNGFGGLINYTYTNVPDQEFKTYIYAYEVNEDPNDVEYRVSDPAQRDYYEVTGFTSKTISQQEPMVGQSKDTLNASVYYEDETYSVRLSYNYRSEYAKATLSEGVLYRDARQQLDLKATYNITDNLVASLAITNLTNENEVNYINSSQQLKDPEFNIMKWEDDGAGGRQIAKDAEGVEIVESTITGQAAWDKLSSIVNIPAADLKPYYENHLDKIVVNQYTNGRRFYLGINWKF